MAQLLIPTKISLKRDTDLTLVWPDGSSDCYPVTYLRANCPCATCRELRASQAKSRLTVLPSNFVGTRIEVVRAEMVGNYALRIDWSDNHGSGIYSFSYLREIAPPRKS